MADVEQNQTYAAEFERQKTPSQVLQLARYRGVQDPLSMTFLVQAYLDGHALTAKAETAKDAFAKAIEWHVVGRLADVSISDGAQSYSIAEFSSVMALVEIANTIETDINAET